MSNDAAPNGYLHPAYAASLAEFGTPRALPHSGGWVLQRPIPGTDRHDAMGCYPLFACRAWPLLPRDLSEVGRELVSLVLVADPFGAYDEGELRACFPDLCLPFKSHFVTDLTRTPASFVDPHHQRNVRKALKTLDVERAPHPEQCLGAWTELYANLTARHAITGISAFSKASFEIQLGLPGLTMFCAREGGEIVGMTLWYAHGGVGYYHLGAYSERGYASRASFALFWHALEYFAGAGCRALDLGAGAGLNDDAADGLSRFKRGWSTGTRTAYLCGRIFDVAEYARLTRAAGSEAARYFPAYRSGEFG